MAAKKRIDGKSFTISFILLLVSFLMLQAMASRGKPVVIAVNLENLPMQIKGMKGIEDSFSEAIYRSLNADKNIYRHYRDMGGRQASLYIGYYGTAKGGRTSHDPLFCMPSQGWALVNSREINIKSGYYPEGVPVKYLLAIKDGRMMTSIYWYQTDGNKVLSNGIRQNLMRFVGLVLHNRNDGAFVQIMVAGGREDTAYAEAFARDFAKEVMEMLPKYWPQEVDS